MRIPVTDAVYWKPNDDSRHDIGTHRSFNLTAPADGAWTWKFALASTTVYRSHAWTIMDRFNNIPEMQAIIPSCHIFEGPDPRHTTLYRIQGSLVCRGDGDITPWCAFGIKVDTDTLEDHSDGSVDAAACLAVPCTGGHSNMQSLAVDTVVALDPDTEFTGVDFDDSLVMCGWALGNAHASADSSYTSLIASLSVRRYDAQIGYLDPYRS